MSKIFHQITKNEKKLIEKIKIQQTIINIKYKNKMKTYCVKCKKDTENLDSKIFRTKNNRLIMQSKCSDCEKNQDL